MPEGSDEQRNIFAEETDDPKYADERNLYKLEKWTKDGTKVDRLLSAGNNLDKARLLFQAAIKHRPRIRLTIRQRTRVVRQWLKAIERRANGSGAATERAHKKSRHFGQNWRIVVE